MKSKEEIREIIESGIDDAWEHNDLYANICTRLILAVYEYANQFQSDASSEEIRKWGKGCTNCGIKELITDGYCNCCGAVQMIFLK